MHRVHSVVCAGPLTEPALPPHTTPVPVVVLLHHDLRAEPLVQRLVHQLRALGRGEGQGMAYSLGQLGGQVGLVGGRGGGHAGIRPAWQEGVGGGGAWGHACTEALSRRMENGEGASMPSPHHVAYGSEGHGEGVVAALEAQCLVSGSVGALQPLAMSHLTKPCPAQPRKVGPFSSRPDPSSSPDHHPPPLRLT